MANATNLAESMRQIDQLAEVFQGSRSNVLDGQTLKYLEIGNELNGARGTLIGALTT